MLRFKVDPMVLLKEKGYTSHKLRLDKVFGEATMTKMRHRRIVSMNEFERLCSLLDEQPGNLIEYVPDTSDVPPVRTVTIIPPNSAYAASLRDNSLKKKFYSGLLTQDDIREALSHHDESTAPAGDSGEVKTPE